MNRTSRSTTGTKLKVRERLSLSFSRRARHWRLVALSLLLVSALTSPLLARAQAVSIEPLKGAGVMSIRQTGRVRAPELSGGRGWLNTDKPLSLAALRGKVVLLDFWTYGCINCMHIIPDLKRLEAKYTRELVVIGVHSAKFDNEKETENIRRVVLRYGIEHPVVNDADFRIWQSYTVRAWPTQVLIDPAGYVVGKVEGEGNFDAMDKTIAETVADFRRRGSLNEQPLKLTLERAKVGDLPLAFPGKVLADEKTNRLFIADSNHNRIVVARLDGTLIDTIGTGAEGSRDGRFDEANFYRPQGMALDGDALYVADTANHLLRRVDLKARTVSTLAGTGEQLRDYGTMSGAARTTALSSPWDLQLVGRTLFIAMAGPHQIWQLDLTKQQLAVFAGSGREARVDGERFEAAFAQPSGLATDGRTLYVADSESNIIRAVDLGGAGVTATATLASAAYTTTSGTKASSSSNATEEVRTLAGGDLFEFGDLDGRGDDVRLQHPLGLAYHEGKLFIADTYNHKIKQLDPQARTVKTFAGGGGPGQTDGARPRFYEPGGLSIAAGRLYIADTNNHAVRVIDLNTRQTSTLKLSGLEPPARSAFAAPAADESSDAFAPEREEIRLAPQQLRAGATGTLVVEVALPAGYHLNPAAPQRYKISVESGGERLTFDNAAASASAQARRDAAGVSAVTKQLQLPLRLPLRIGTTGTAQLRIQLTLFYCREDNTGTCRIKTLAWRAPVEVTGEESAPREIKAQAKVE